MAAQVGLAALVQVASDAQKVAAEHSGLLVNLLLSIALLDDEAARGSYFELAQANWNAEDADLRQAALTAASFIAGQEATTLPQMAIPKIMGSPNYIPHVRRRSEILCDRAKQAFERLKEVDGIDITMPEGALYMTVRFQDGALSGGQTLPIDNPKIRELITRKVEGTTLDKRFVLYLLGSTGICVVPLTSFCSHLEGFRFTLLETDDARRDWIYRQLAVAIEAYLKNQ